MNLIVPVASLRALLAELAADADEIDRNTAAGTYEAEEAAERGGVAGGIRHAVNCLRVDLLGDAGPERDA